LATRSLDEVSAYRTRSRSSSSSQRSERERRFLPRDATPKGGTAVGRRPSVRLSHWCVVSRRLKVSSYFSIVLVAHHCSFNEPKIRYPVSREPTHKEWAKLRFSTRKLHTRMKTECCGIPARM